MTYYTVRMNLSNPYLFRHLNILFVSVLLFALFLFCYVTDTCRHVKLLYSVTLCKVKQWYDRFECRGVLDRL